LCSFYLLPHAIGTPWPSCGPHWLSPL
jgi:hypothetical protein